MRVTSELWVSALTRRVFSGGGFAAVVKRGAGEAGAIFVTTRDRLGLTTLYGPAPQTAYETERPDDRQFALLLDAKEAHEVEERLAREQRFDSDIWVVEIELGEIPLAALLQLTTP